MALLIPGFTAESSVYDRGLQYWARPQTQGSAGNAHAIVASQFSTFGGGFLFRPTMQCCGWGIGPLGRPVPLCRTYEVPPFHTCRCLTDSYAPPVCRPWVISAG